MSTVPLSAFAHGRSGDKGNHANIAVIAYTLAGFAWLREHLTAEVVAKYFERLGPSRVERFEVPNLLAVNFLLYDALAGGASRSLRVDTQGKTLALALLQMEIERPANVEAMARTEVLVSGTSSAIGSSAALLAAMAAEPHPTAEDVAELEKTIADGERPPSPVDLFSDEPAKPGTQ
jgi:hypothetical protein